MDSAQYSNQCDQLFPAIARGPWHRVGVIFDAPAHYLKESQSVSLVDQCRQFFGDRMIAVLHFDSGFTELTWHALPCLFAPRANADMFDALVLLSPGFSEVLFHFFNTSPLRQIRLFAPFLTGRPQRQFIHHRIRDFLEHRSSAHVLEIGAIEHIGGGHRTTQAFAEALWLDGTITTIDRLPLSLELSRYYCRGLPTPLTTLQGDLEEILERPPAELQNRCFDFVLLHQASDNGSDQTLRAVFDRLRPLMAADAWVMFQSLHEANPRPGSLQAHLLTNDFAIDVMQIDNAVDVTRFIVIARPKAARPPIVRSRLNRSEADGPNNGAGAGPRVSSKADVSHQVSL